jgi:Mn2+/Fe2+ NRAMP family transporter
MRLALFLVCLVAVYAIGLRGFTALVVALVASGLISLFLLARQRAAMSVAVDRRMSRLRTRAQARTRAEDAYVDSRHDDEVRTTRAGG